MENREKIERPLMEMEEFEALLEAKKAALYEDLAKGIVHLSTYQAVGRYKSVARAIRRGHCTLDGIIYPKRPFNNRGGNRPLNERKKKIYGQLKKREAA